MSDTKRIQRTLGTVLFAVGVLIGMIFYGSVLWSDFEASFFDASIRTQGSIPQLSCPILITQRETGQITATLENTLDRPITPRVRTHITDGSYILMREEESAPKIQPGEQAQLEWAIRVEDAAWDRFVLARVFVFPTYPIPAMSGYCGVVALKLSALSGPQVVTLSLLGSLLLMGAGMALWVAGNRQQETNTEITAGMGLLAGVTIAGVVTSIIGWWLLAGILLLITILVAVGLLVYVMNQH
jgi:hypothetical protein